MIFLWKKEFCSPEYCCLLACSWHSTQNPCQTPFSHSCKGINSFQNCFISKILSSLLLELLLTWMNLSYVSILLLAFRVSKKFLCFNWWEEFISSSCFSILYMISVVFANPMKTCYFKWTLKQVSVIQFASFQSWVPCTFSYSAKFEALT